MIFNNKKASEEVTITIVVILAVLLVIGGLTYAYYANHKLKHETYVNVIADLDDADRCLYQCGFLYEGPTLLENYKFCIEKCDRIHERNCEVNSK